jgi:redox-sensing transcriptional repressor
MLERFPVPECSAARPLGTRPLSLLPPSLTVSSGEALVDGHASAVAKLPANPHPCDMNDPKGKSPGPAPDGPVPKAVVSRLSLYLRELQHLIRDGHETTSSNQLGGVLGFTDAQVRKDLAYFGHFGYPGIGYRCDELVTAIRKILGTDQQWPAVLVGAGNLGRALLGYKGFQQRGFRIVAAFDTEAVKVGSSIEGVPVYHLDSLPEVAKKYRIRLGMIAVPASAAQTVADRLVAVGVEGILNFAPVTISLPPTVSQVSVDLAIELEQLSFSVVNRPESE